MAPLAESDQPYCSAIGTMATEMDALSMEHMSETAAQRPTTNRQSGLLSSCGASWGAKLSAEELQLEKL